MISMLLLINVLLDIWIGLLCINFEMFCVIKVFCGLVMCVCWSLGVGCWVCEL